jgi:septum formation protein
MLILASGSPRRREILSQLGIAFEVRAADVDETPLEGEKAIDLARRLARAKCERASASASASVLAADTVVDVDGVPFNKPVDDDDARRMITLLAGRTHCVHTAIALCAFGEITVRSVTTGVMFRSLTDDEIARYVASGEGRDKAGAYALQGLGGGMITSVRGSPSNVIGLPAAETVALLVERGVIARWP